MSHWAKIDNANFVENILFFNNDEIENEEKWLQDNVGGNWVQTSYNTKRGIHILGGTPFRKNYACIGMIYDEIRDAFYWPQPYPSWILNEETCIWEAPVAYPNDGKQYKWNETTQEWIEA